MFIIQQFQCFAYVNNDCYLWLVCYCQSFHKCVSSCVIVVVSCCGFHFIACYRSLCTLHVYEAWSIRIRIRILGAVTASVDRRGPKLTLKLTLLITSCSYKVITVTVTSLKISTLNLFRTYNAKCTNKIFGGPYVMLYTAIGWIMRARDVLPKWHAISVKHHVRSFVSIIDCRTRFIAV